MDSIFDLIESFRKKYLSEKSLFDFLKDKYCLSNIVNNSQRVMTFDIVNNREIINNLLKTFDKYADKIKRDSNNISIEKILTQYATKLSELTNIEYCNDNNRMSSAFAKLLDSTLLKIYEKYKNEILSYFKENGICYEIFSEGNIISESDFAYLDELSFKFVRPTEDISMNNRVIRMDKPIIKIYFMDGDQPDFKCIPGRCEFYAYNV